MHRDVQRAIGRCTDCLRASLKSEAFRYGSIGSIAPATKPWQRVHVDFAGPLPKVPQGSAPFTKDGANAVMLVVDAFSRYTL